MKNKLGPNTKPNLFLFVMIALAAATIFGIVGYYYGKQSTATQPGDKPLAVDVSPKPSQTEQVTPTPTNPKIKKLSYKLPANWKTASDTIRRLEVGYDPSRYDATAKIDGVYLSGKWVGTQGSDLQRLGWNKYFFFSAYTGGSRHAELYNILGVTASESSWKSPKYYSEKEYSYNGWNCLVINGVNISQYPVAWGYCPISGNEAIVLTFDSYNWSEIEQQISAIRLLK